MFGMAVVRWKKSASSARMGWSLFAEARQNASYRAQPSSPDLSTHGQALMKLYISLRIVTIFQLHDLLQQFLTAIGQKCAANYRDAHIAELKECILTSDGALASTPIPPAHVAEQFPWLLIRIGLGVCHAPARGWKGQGMGSGLGRFKRMPSLRRRLNQYRKRMTTTGDTPAARRDSVARHLAQIDAAIVDSATAPASRHR